MPQRRSALSTYEAKRDFSRTSEPKAGGKSTGDLFVVQHHWASREHYDFRLELDGVLLSWAVTRGPSFNPADRRLAVRTEDHPVAYAKFEGTIPKGDYGGGTVQVWDRGRWEPQPGIDPRKSLQKGSLKFVLHGKRMRGRWVLVRMKSEDRRENWLLIKERDEYATDNGSIDRFTTSVQTGRTKTQIERSANGSRKSTPKTSAKKAPNRGSAIAPSQTLKVEPKPKKPHASKRSSDTKIDPRLERITHPERVVFAKAGVTKGDVAAYYLAVADRILPYLVKRPISFVRAPEGLGGEIFFQRHLLKGMSKGILQIPDPDKEHADWVAVIDEEGLITCAQFGIIELHGWGSTVPKLTAPDRVVFDLDPDPAVKFSEVRSAALELRSLLKGIELKSFPLLSGGKGIHVVVPLDRTQDWETIGDFASGLARGLAETDPKRYVAVASKAKRRGKIYIDWLRNKMTASAIVPWSLRARQEASVAVPVTWSELQSARSGADFTLSDALRRRDPWKDYFATKQRIHKQVAAFLGSKAKGR